MNAKVRDVAGDHEGSSLDDPLPMDVQFSIIEEVTGSKGGQHISGVGKCVKKPPRPKGGYKVSAKLQDDLQVRAEEREKMKELEERVKMLEEMVRGNNAVVEGNASDGATSLMP